MEASILKNLQLTPDEVMVITSLYDTIWYVLNEEECDISDLVYAIARGQHRSGDITITYLDKKTE